MPGTRNLEVVHPPTDDNMGGVVAISTTVTDEQDTGITGVAGSVAEMQMNFVADIDCYIIFDADSTITDISTADVAGEGRAWLMPADTVFSWKITARSRYFVAIAGDDGHLRWYEDR